MFKQTLYQFIFHFVFIICAHSTEFKITSDNLEVDRENKISIFSGSVYAYSSDLEIWSSKLTIQFNKNEDKVQQIHAEDEVKIINRGVTATGEMSIYYPETETLNMYRNVEILQNDNYVTCDELFLDIKNSTSIMKSNSAKRVEAFIISN